ncbi:MAG: prefoldin subunit beta [Nanoarchaeota archaeon]|nr:prefoldin subunit beta [Nanoarchaeota archaeon]
MEDMNKETEQKIGQLQLMEQNLQNFATQKQTFQTQLFEIENALKELENCKDKTYKIVGTVMIASDKKELIKDLNEKKSMIELRIKTLEKQEKAIKEKASHIQTEVMSKLKKK